MPSSESNTENISTMDGVDEFEFVVNQIAAVLSGNQSRSLLYELAADAEAGADLGQDTDWHCLDGAAIERLVRIAVSASLCRSMLLIVYADRELSKNELDFVQRSMNPFVTMLRHSCAVASCPEAINSGADCLAFSNWLKGRSRDLFAEDGLGGKASSVPRLCSLCDPFVETPLLPVYLYAVRRLCVMAANADGMSAEEQSVLESFDRLTDRCETISRKVAARLPEVSVFKSTLDSNSSLPDIQATQRTLEAASTERETILTWSAGRSRLLESRIAANHRRNASCIFEDWNSSTVFLLFTCWLFVVGVGFLAAKLFHSRPAGLIVTPIALVVATRFVVEGLLNLSWFSTTKMEAELRNLHLTGYKAWKELTSVDQEVERLDDLARSMIAAIRARQAEARAEETRLQAERQRRSAAMSSYVAPSGGPIRVRSYRRRDGTFVQTHTRRRRR
jgi:hypothetical protein